MATRQLTADILTGPAFLARLGEGIERARTERYPYALVACVPQRFLDEDVSPLVRTAATCVRELVRDGDVTGVLDGDVLLMGLPDTDPTEARVFSSRLQSELTMRSHHLRSTIWDPGAASLGADGASLDELLPAAIDAARNRRRRLAG